ncbi:DUF3800 domain-containing protein [Corynebacterium flavescens]
MLNEAGQRTLFVFMDESGDLQFTPQGKQHFILSAVYTDDPASLASEMQKLKYDLLAKGSDDLEFHATQNTKGTRKRVVDLLCELEGYGVHSLWIDKAYTHPTYQDEVKLLALFGTAMGKWIHKARSDGYDKVVMIFDSVLTGKKQSAFIKELKPCLKETGKEFKILFHPVKQDLNGQVADYFSWSFFRSMEGGDHEHFYRLKARTEWTNFNLFQRGHIRYWGNATTPPTK